VTDANGTVIDYDAGDRPGVDFHDKKYDKKTDLVATAQRGLNISDRVNLSLERQLFQRQLKTRTVERERTRLARLYRADIRLSVGRCDSSYTTGYIQNAAGVVGDSHPLFQHVMLLRGYGVKDTVGQLHADFTYKGDSRAKAWPFSIGAGFFFRRQEGYVALFERWWYGLHDLWLQ